MTTSYSIVDFPGAPVAATRMIERLRKTVAVLEAPKCDIGDGEALKRIFGQYQHMPPIAGGVQSAKALGVSERHSRLGAADRTECALRGHIV